MVVPAWTHGNASATTAIAVSVRALMKANPATVMLIATSSFSANVMINGPGQTLVPSWRRKVSSVTKHSNVKSVNSVGTKLQRIKNRKPRVACHCTAKNMAMFSDGALSTTLCQHTTITNTMECTVNRESPSHCLLTLHSAPQLTTSNLMMKSWKAHISATQPITQITASSSSIPRSTKKAPQQIKDRYILIVVVQWTETTDSVDKFSEPLSMRHILLH